MCKNEQTAKGLKPETLGLSIAGIGDGDEIAKVLPIGGRDEPSRLGIDRFHGSPSLV